MSIELPPRAEFASEELEVIAHTMDRERELAMVPVRAAFKATLERGNGSESEEGGMVRAVIRGKVVVGWFFRLHNCAMRGDGIAPGDYEYEEHDLCGIILAKQALANPVDWEGTIHRAAYIRIDDIEQTEIDAI
ncbi:MAG: hypothetical protein V3W44_04385 [Dehalococcoidales bacterium]